jgi:hypothetical protein
MLYLSPRILGRPLFFGGRCRCQVQLECRCSLFASQAAVERLDTESLGGLQGLFSARFGRLKDAS